MDPQGDGMVGAGTVPGRFQDKITEWVGGVLSVRGYPTDDPVVPTGHARLLFTLLIAAADEIVLHHLNTQVFQQFQHGRVVNAALFNVLNSIVVKLTILAGNGRPITVSCNRQARF